MTDVRITVNGTHHGIDSSVLCELMANFLHAKGLQVELMGEPITTDHSQAPKAVEICQQTTTQYTPVLNSPIPLYQLAEEMDSLEGSFTEVVGLLEAVIQSIETRIPDKAVGMLYGIQRLITLLNQDYSQLHHRLHQAGVDYSGIPSSDTLVSYRSINEWAYMTDQGGAK